MTNLTNTPQPPQPPPEPPIERPLEQAIETLARAQVLLVASDYDGTIAPIVDDPAAALPHRESVIALRMLASLPRTHVAVISGRSLAHLSELAGLPPGLHLVGSHGSEFDQDFHAGLPDDARAIRGAIIEQLGEIAARAPGLMVEVKPASAALHYRLAGPDDAARALHEVESGPATLPGVTVKRGKMVVELCIFETNKGRALDVIRRRCGATATIFIGDDVTDEDAFETLRTPDAGVKVGLGPTAAAFRVDSTRAVCRLLAGIAEQREAWLEEGAAVPIEQHSVLSDQRTMALVTPDGRITWMCAPRIDSPAIFAEMLGGEPAGAFSVRAASGPPASQSYLPDTMILRTEWDALTVTDLLDCSGSRTSQRAGRTDLIRVIEGAGEAVVRFAPRLDFGRVATRLTRREHGLVVEDTHDPIVLRAPGVEWELVEEGPHHTAFARVRPGDTPLTLELRFGSGDLGPARVPPADRVRMTSDGWRSWMSRLDALPDDTLARRSAMILKSLCYGPTGAILAAGTTSLPEHIGGLRNWDYRYCWLRDAAMSAASLVSLGSTDEAMAFLNWMISVVESCQAPDRLHPVYTVVGHELGPEAEIGELSGYRGSRPVRVGNGASTQVQLDVYGPVVNLVWKLLELDAPLSSEHWRLVNHMMTAVERRWREPDHGIWEIRKARRHHVHSKVMNWMTADRAVLIAARLRGVEMPAWADLRDQIRDDILANGFKPGVNAFTAAYDGQDLDAAALSVGLTGLLPPSDPRFVGTVQAVEKHLRDGPTVHRYLADDGLPGHEGGFHLCAGWLIESYLLIGRHDDAQRLYDDMCALAGPTGLLSEEYLPSKRLALGNTPQAYSHLAVIDAALALQQARRGG